MPHKWGEWVDFKERTVLQVKDELVSPGMRFVDHDFMVTRTNSVEPIRWLWASNYEQRGYPMQYMLWVERDKWGIP